MHSPLWLAPLFFSLPLIFCSPSSSSSSSSVSDSTVITHLPGFQGRLPFHLETGYVNVDEEKGAELFYYYTRSERNPGEDPFLIWLSGGPGCSSISGLLYELGPLELVVAEYDGSLPRVQYRPFTWTKIASIIFVDCPVGTGFSYSAHPDDLGDLSTSRHVYNFIIKWFRDHPQFISNPLYIAGDSYAGKFVPVITHMVARGLEAGVEPFLNLKGYIMGNPFTGENFDENSRVPFAHGMGIISDELAQSIERSCKDQDHRNPHTAECAEKLEIFQKFYNEVNDFCILDVKCPYDDYRIATPLITRFSKEKIRSLEEHAQLHHPPSFPDLQCRNYIYFLSYYWMNDERTRKALGVREGTVEEWVRSNYSIAYDPKVYDKDVPSTFKYQLDLLLNGYRALVYSGDHDFAVPFVGTYEWIKSFNFSAVQEWRSWQVGGQVAGYTVSYYNNLTFATVKGAGHTAPEFKSEECFNMFGRWVSHQPL